MTRLSTPDTEPADPAAFWRWVWSSVRPVLGYVLVAFGLVLLLTAYLGVSREVLVARQLPYLVSGGLFGLALVTLGSRLLLIEDLRRDSGRLDKLERAVADLHAALLARPDAPLLRAPVDDPSGIDAPSSRNGHGPTQQLIALAGGDRVHRPDCPIVEGKEAAKAVTPSTAQRRRLQACPMCQPVVGGV